MSTALDLLANTALDEMVVDHSDISTLSSSALSSEASSSPVGKRQLRSRRSTSQAPKRGKINPELQRRRREFKDRAMNIKSLQNSPVNGQQLEVLKIVFDEITMHPIDSWVSIMAIVLNRSFRQVKNWFSNCRQKHRRGELTAVYSDVGDCLRLRPSALLISADWSDQCFEEFFMIVHFWKLQKARTQPHGPFTIIHDMKL